MNLPVKGGPQIIIPRGFKMHEHPFADMLAKPAQMNEVVRGIQQTLADSFKEDEIRLGLAFRQRIQTDTEINRRTQILFQWFRTLRGDLGYSVARCLAELPVALRAALHGDIYAPKRERTLFGVPEGEAIA